MSGTATILMTVEEFFVWQQRQEDRYELVEGAPVKLMTGASEAHDVIVTNLLSGMHRQLRGAPCRAATADLAVRTRNLTSPHLTSPAAANPAPAASPASRRNTARSPSTPSLSLP